MRQGCLQCFLKHIGNASVLIDEVHDGYPYRHLVLGHLDQAAQEIREFSKEFALLVRAHRLKWLADQYYRIPFEAMESYVSYLEEVPGRMSEIIIPEECYDGLDKLASGDGWNLMTGDQR